MRSIFTVFLFALCSICYAEEGDGLYNFNHTIFDAMPHEHILKNEFDKCETEANAEGSPEESEPCKQEIISAIKELSVLNKKRITPSMSWSLCVGFAEDGVGYDYPIWDRCMRVVNNICPINQNKDYIDMRKCVVAMQSGYWINNPKTEIPIQP